MPPPCSRRVLALRMNHSIIITHAVLVGLTPLIPIPGLDDLVKAFFYRNMVKALAAAYGAELSADEIARLAEEQGSGCLNGCLFWLIEFLVKRTVRKVLFVLEWRRAIDLVTHTYYAGYLLDYAFKQGWYAPGDVNRAAQLRAAVEHARAGANTTLVNRIVRSSFDESRALIVGVVQQVSNSVRDIAFRRSRMWLRRTLATRLRRRAPRLARWLYSRAKPAEAEQVALTESQVAQTLERETPGLNRALSGLVEQLQARITSLPEGHFDELEKRLAASLKPGG